MSAPTPDPSAWQSLAACRHADPDLFFPPGPPGAPAALRQEDPAAPLTPDAALAVLLGTGSERALAELLGVPRSRVQAWRRLLADAGAEAEAEGAGQPPAIRYAHTLNGAGAGA